MSFKPKAKEEIFGGFIENRSSNDLLTPCSSHEFASHQRAENAARINTANLGDLRGGDGLLVGNDGEGSQAPAMKASAAA